MYHKVKHLKQSSSWNPERTSRPSLPPSLPQRSATPHIGRNCGTPHPCRSGRPTPQPPVTRQQHHGEIGNQPRINGRLSPQRSGTPDIRRNCGTPHPCRDGRPTPALTRQQHVDHQPRINVWRDPPLRRVHFGPSERYGPALDIPELNLRPNNRLNPIEDLMKLVEIDYDAEGDRETTRDQPKLAHRERPKHSQKNRERRLGKSPGKSEKGKGEKMEKKSEKGKGKKMEKKQHGLHQDLKRQPTPNWERLLRGMENFDQVFSNTPPPAHDQDSSIKVTPSPLTNDLLTSKDLIPNILTQSEFDAVKAHTDVNDDEEDVEEGLHKLLVKYGLDVDQDDVSSTPGFIPTPSPINAPTVSPAAVISPDLDRVLKEISCARVPEDLTPKHRKKDIASLDGRLGSYSYHYGPRKTPSPEVLTPQPPNSATSLLKASASNYVPPVPPPSSRMTTTRHQTIPEDDVIQPPLFIFPNRLQLAPRRPSTQSATNRLRSFGPLKVSDDRVSPLKPSRPLHHKRPDEKKLRKEARLLTKKTRIHNGVQIGDRFLLDKRPSAEDEKSERKDAKLLCETPPQDSDDETEVTRLPTPEFAIVPKESEEKARETINLLKRAQTPVTTAPNWLPFNLLSRSVLPRPTPPAAPPVSPEEKLPQPPPKQIGTKSRGTGNLRRRRYSLQKSYD